MTSSQTPPVNSAAEDKWWVAQSNKHQGPFSRAKIDAGIRTGQISPTTLICAVGAEEWITAGEAEQFQANFENVESRSGSVRSEPVDSALNAAKKVRLPTPPNLTKDRLKSAFRYLLVGEIVFCLLAFSLMVIGEVIFADNYPEIQYSGSYGWIAMFSFAILFVIFLPATILAWVGLFGFKNWARWLYLGLILAGKVLLLPFAVLDYTPTWMISTLAGDIGTMCSGAVAALAFFSPLSDCFITDEVEQEK